jgi:UAA transporter family
LKEKWRYPLFLNTVQSLFAALTAFVYLHLTEKKAPAIFPNSKIFLPLLLVAITQSLASPFGYASLEHIDYITYILAKSCKLLPVMALHLTVFQKRYPLYKYAVVAAVTAGVAVFTLHQPASPKKKGREGGSSLWGLFLLAINLLFDGLTNSTQDYIFTSYRPYSGPQMMCAQNLLSTLLTVTYLLISPMVANTAFGGWIGVKGGRGGEFSEALAFMGRHKGVSYDVLGFAICGAIGQLFICKGASLCVDASVWMQVQRRNPFLHAGTPSSLSLREEEGSPSQQLEKELASSLARDAGDEAGAGITVPNPVATYRFSSAQYKGPSLSLPSPHIISYHFSNGLYTIPCLSHLHS